VDTETSDTVGESFGMEPEVRAVCCQECKFSFNQIYVGLRARLDILQLEKRRGAGETKF